MRCVLNGKSKLVRLRFNYSELADYILCYNILNTLFYTQLSMYQLNRRLTVSSGVMKDMPCDAHCVMLTLTTRGLFDTANTAGERWL